MLKNYQLVAKKNNKFLGMPLFIQRMDRNVNLGVHEHRLACAMADQDVAGLSYVVMYMMSLSSPLQQTIPLTIQLLYFSSMLGK